jgi:hypothetical protein
MIEDIPATREQLADHWEKIAVDLIKRGFPARAVFETLTTVGLAGEVEVSGKDVIAQKLVAVAERLSDQVRTEALALEEAARATKN